MIVTCVYISVKPEFVEKFIEATIKNHQNSIKEEGNLRFDFLKVADSPNEFMLYEVYENEEAVKAHKETAHYFEWRDTVSGWMTKARTGIRHEVIAPTNLNLW